MVEAWSTHWALETGVVYRIEGDAEVTALGRGSFYGKCKGGGHLMHGPNDWSRTFEDAVAQAEKKRVEQIEDLREELARLEVLEFKAEE